MTDDVRQPDNDAIPPGWTARTWVDQLRHLASVAIDRARASELTAMAARIERRNAGDAGQAVTVT